jgi:hypothetical protein
MAGFFTAGMVGNLRAIDRRLHRFALSSPTSSHVVETIGGLTPFDGAKPRQNIETVSTFWNEPAEHGFPKTISAG